MLAQAAWGISLSAKGMLNAKPSHKYKKNPVSLNTCSLDFV